MKKNEHHRKFIARLQKLVKENKGGAVAALKRSLQGETTSQIAAYPYVVPFLPKDYRGNDWAYFLVAGLFAMHPRHSPEYRNLGTTCQVLGSEDDNPGASWVLRFKALLDAEQDDVAHHLRSIIGMAASKDIAVNYMQMLTDLCRWSHPEKYAQSAMAREFWRLPSQDAESSTEENTTA